MNEISSSNAIVIKNHNNLVKHTTYGKCLDYINVSRFGNLALCVIEVMSIPLQDVCRSAATYDSCGQQATGGGREAQAMDYARVQGGSD